MAIYDNRVCRECGITFSGGPRAWYCPECRAERQRRRQRIYKAEHSKRPLGSTDLCENCGAEYIVESGMQKYCPKCQPIMHKKLDNEQGKKYYREKVDKDERNAKRRKHYAENRERESLNRRFKYAMNAEKFRARAKKWRQANPEKVKEYQKRDAERNKEHKKEYRKMYCMTHRAQMRAKANAYRAAHREHLNELARKNYQKRMERSK